MKFIVCGCFAILSCSIVPVGFSREKMNESKLEGSWEVVFFAHQTNNSFKSNQGLETSISDKMTIVIKQSTFEFFEDGVSQCKAKIKGFISHDLHTGTFDLQDESDEKLPLTLGRFKLNDDVLVFVLSNSKIRPAELRMKVNETGWLVKCKRVVK